VTILIIGSVLLGAILGRFFKVLVLVPACALVLAVVLVKSADGEHGLLRPLLEFAVLITSLQIGYVFSLVSHSMSERGGTTAAPAPLRGHRRFNTSRGLKAPSPTASMTRAGSPMDAPVLDEIGAPVLNFHDG
jgi:hypothetical protein